MRRLLLLPLLLLAASACTPSSGGTTDASESSTTASSTTAPTTSTSTTVAPDGFGGELVVGQMDSIPTLNPFAPDAFGIDLAGNLTWARVYDIEPETWDRVPDMVTALPSRTGAIEVNDDGSMTVRYEIRADARWSDGVPITGEDLAFTAGAMRDLAERGVGNVDAVMASVIEADSVDRIAFITFAEPTLAFEDALWIILPKHALDGVDLVDGTDGSDWPAGGPFVVERFDPFESVRFIRNKFYGKVDDAGRRLPYLDAITITETTELGVQANEPASPIDDFVSRDLDVAVLPRSPADIDRARAADGSSIELVPTPVIEHLTFQFGEVRDEANPRSGNDALEYRRAVAQAIDRAALLSETSVPWFDDTPGLLVPLGASAWERYPFDPDAAAALIDETFGVDDPSLRPAARLFTTGNGEYRIRIGDALESRFDAVGIPYEAEYQDSVVFFGETLTSGTFDVGMWAWINDGGFASTVRLLDQFDVTSGTDLADIGSWTEAGGGDVATSESGRTFADLAAEARSTTDPERFADLAAEADGLLADQLPIVPLFHRAAAYAWWPDVALGIVPNGSSSDITWNAELWQRAGE